MRIIFDLDGTLADLTHRLPLIQQTPRDWRGFFAAVGDDQPIASMVALCIDLSRIHSVEIWSGRSDECETQTVAWLHQHGLVNITDLRMRKAGDHQPDEKLKEAWLCALPTNERPDLVFDDRTRIVEMWRSNGVRCCQVAPGDF